MSEEDCGASRAQGAFSNFLENMENEMELRNRSPEYVKAFWEALKDAVCDFGLN